MERLNELTTEYNTIMRNINLGYTYYELNNAWVNLYDEKKYIETEIEKYFEKIENDIFPYCNVIFF